MTTTTKSITFQGITITLTATIDGASEATTLDFITGFNEGHKETKAAIEDAVKSGIVFN